MKEVKAYIQPFMLQKVIDALHKIHVHGMSVCEIKGCGKEKDEKYPHDSRDYVTEFTSKVKIEVICLGEDVDKIVETLRKNARTGRRGDGKIFITNIEMAMSIRTGAVNDKTL